MTETLRSLGESATKGMTESVLFTNYLHKFFFTCFLVKKAEDSYWNEVYECKLSVKFIYSLSDFLIPLSTLHHSMGFRISSQLPHLVNSSLYFKTASINF